MEKEKKIDNQTIDSLVDYLDSFFEKDGGHINVTVEDEKHVSVQTMTVDKKVGCTQGACQIPTEELDIPEEE